MVAPGPHYRRRAGTARRLADLAPGAGPTEGPDRGGRGPGPERGVEDGASRGARGRRRGRVDRPNGRAGERGREPARRRASTDATQGRAPLPRPAAERRAAPGAPARAASARLRVPARGDRWASRGAKDQGGPRASDRATGSAGEALAGTSWAWGSRVGSTAARAATATAAARVGERRRHPTEGPSRGIGCGVAFVYDETNPTQLVVIVPIPRDSTSKTNRGRRRAGGERDPRVRAQGPGEGGSGSSLQVSPGLVINRTQTGALPQSRSRGRRTYPCRP